LPRKERIEPEIVLEKPVWAVCKCGGDIRYWNDNGLRCTSCRLLHGTWRDPRGRKKNISSILKRQSELLR
tara:strand:- start:290 stop:499 length:210 start_codon:yes stop_codon:yes gene_type:complete